MTFSMWGRYDDLRVLVAHRTSPYLPREAAVSNGRAKHTVREMTNSGLRTIDYASGWANRVEVAARRAIMTGMGQLTSKINEDNARALETDMFEITWHSGYRPEHWWGGKWYSRNDLVKICGLGSVTGLCGANCYHDYYPVIPGISVPLYTDEQFKAMNEAEQKPVEWKGKTYTKYEATQRQRALETTMRAQRQEMQLLKEGGADEDDLINLRARYRATSQEYVRFSEAAGLPQQRERVSVDGLGNIMQGKYTGGSGKESPVKVPPVGAKRGTPVQDAERSELLEHPRMVLTSGAQSGIIKPITIQDIDERDSSGTISDECRQTIIDTLKSQKASYLYDDIAIINIPRDQNKRIEPLRTNAIETPGYPRVILEINEAAFAGLTKERVDNIFKIQKYCVANSLEEAVIHECAHAKIINGITYSRYKAIDEELSGELFTKPIPGRADKKSLKDLAGEISEYAQKDGLECIAECHVILSRGETIPKELQELYDRFMK